MDDPLVRASKKTDKEQNRRRRTEAAQREEALPPAQDSADRLIAALEQIAQHQPIGHVYFNRLESPERRGGRYYWNVCQARDDETKVFVISSGREILYRRRTWNTTKDHRSHVDGHRMKKVRRPDSHPELKATLARAADWAEKRLRRWERP